MTAQDPPSRPTAAPKILLAMVDRSDEGQPARTSAKPIASHFRVGVEARGPWWLQSRLSRAAPRSPSASGQLDLKARTATYFAYLRASTTSGLPVGTSDSRPSGLVGFGLKSRALSPADRSTACRFALVLPCREVESASVASEDLWLLQYMGSRWCHAGGTRSDERPARPAYRRLGVSQRRPHRCSGPLPDLAGTSRSASPTAPALQLIHHGGGSA